MYTLLVLLALFISFLLIIVVLLQSSKGSGLAGTFGGSQFGAVFGTRRTADFLSKATWWLAGALIVLSILINLFFLPGKTNVEQRESVIQGKTQQTVPSTPVLPQQSPNPTK